MMRPHIIAYEYRHAEYAARYILNLMPFTFVDNAYRLQGLQFGTEVILVRAPRHVPTIFERERRAQIMELCCVREFKIREVRLP